MDPLSILLGIGGAVQGIYNTDQTRKNNQANEHFTREMYEQQKRDAEAQWHKNNEYNSPRAQMQRFQAAGLNPNLIYGQMGNSAPIANSNPQQHRKEAPTADIVSPSSQAISAYQNYRMSNAQQDNLVAHNSVLKNQAANQAADTAGKIISNSRSALDLDTAKQLQKISLDTAAESLRQMTQQTGINLGNYENSSKLAEQTIRESVSRIGLQAAQQANTTAERENIQARTKEILSSSALKELEMKLAKDGIFPGSPYYLKAVGTFFQRAGIDEWTRKTSTDFKNFFREKPKH